MDESRLGPGGASQVDGRRGKGNRRREGLGAGNDVRNRLREYAVKALYHNGLKHMSETSLSHCPFSDRHTDWHALPSTSS